MFCHQLSVVSLALLFSWFCNFVVSAETSSRQPNIVMIMADDLGYECVGANGGTSYQTPNLDQMAKQGIRFSHCYSQPLCTPSRVKLMTGIYNVRNYEKFGLLPQSQTTFANVLKTAGYKTCIAGKWQLGKAFDRPNQFGFEQYCLWQLTRRPERFPNPGLEINGKAVDFANGEYGPDICCDFICDFIETNKSKPFLVYYPMILTHCPFCPTPDSHDWDPKNKGSKTYKGEAKYFGDMVKYMDKLVGRVLQQLEDSGVAENTLVFFTGDNGTDSPVVSMMGDLRVPGGKGRMDDTGNHVPLIVKWPESIAAGKVTDALVDFSDFFPTILNAANVEVPEDLKLDGHSFLPQLKGQEGTSREWVYIWYSRNGGHQGKSFARNQRFKLYNDGRFFDLKTDPFEKEKQGVQPDSGPDREKAFSMLNNAIQQFRDARPFEVGEVGEAEKRAAKAKKQEKKDKKKNKKKASDKSEKVR